MAAREHPHGGAQPALQRDFWGGLAPHQSPTSQKRPLIPGTRMDRVVRLLTQHGPMRTDAIAQALGSPLNSIQTTLYHLVLHRAVIKLNQRAHPKRDPSRRFSLYGIPGDDRRELLEQDRANSGALLDAVWHGRAA